MPISATMCYNCMSPRTSCTCIPCGDCGDRHYAENICTSCGNCTSGCCNCYRCNHAGCNVRSNNARVICFDCLRCMNHCRCYVCTTCSIRVEPNARRTNWCSHCNNCNAHCNCYSCNSCSVRGNRTSVCQTCSNCPQHCRCATCTVCDNRVRNIHSCGACERCCGCNSCGVKFRNGKFSFHNASFAKGQFKRNKLRRHIAVEIEVDRYSSDTYSASVNRAINKWRDPVVRDGSIGDSGFEITTNPTNGDLFLDHVVDLTNGLKDIRATCTQACGLHVHVNVKGDLVVDKQGKPVLDKNGAFTFDPRNAYSQYDLRRLTTLYKRVEMAMFGLCDERRITSRYSTVCGDYWAGISSDNKKFRKDLLSKMYFEGGTQLEGDKVTVSRHFGSYRAMGNSLREKKRHKYERVRYKALNIHSYFMRGTIEFRHHEGTVDCNEITNWSLVCGTVVDQASKLTEVQIANLPVDSHSALLAILPPSLQEYCKLKWIANNSGGWSRYKLIVQDKFNEAVSITPPESIIPEPNPPAITAVEIDPPRPPSFLTWRRNNTRAGETFSDAINRYQSIYGNTESRS